MLGYSPAFWFMVVIIVFLILWLFWGGKDHEFVGLKALDPRTRDRYTGSPYEWGISRPYNNTDNTDYSTTYEDFTDNYTDFDTLEEAPEICTNRSDPVDNTPALPESIRRITDPLAIMEPPKKPKQFESKGEKICREVIESIYKKKFNNTRPSFLNNPETGRNLEIDCYNDELKIGVEYNGVQHYKWPNFTGQSYEQWVKQVRRDRLKVELCDINGVYLITVPYNVPHNKIRNYIEYYLPENVQKRLETKRTVHVKKHTL